MLPLTIRKVLEEPTDVPVELETECMFTEQVMYCCYHVAVFMEIESKNTSVNGMVHCGYYTAQQEEQGLIYMFTSLPMNPK